MQKPTKRGTMFTHLGTTLRILREEAGLQQAELARQTGVGNSQLSQYELGKMLPKLESLEKILEGLGTDPLTFFYTAHLLQHRAEIPPTAVVMASKALDDPALAIFRRLFEHFLEEFEILAAIRFGKSDQTSNAGRPSTHTPFRNGRKR